MVCLLCSVEVGDFVQVQSSVVLCLTTVWWREVQSLSPVPDLWTKLNRAGFESALKMDLLWVSGTANILVTSYLVALHTISSSRLHYTEHTWEPTKLLCRQCSELQRRNQSGFSDIIWHPNYSRQWWYRASRDVLPQCLSCEDGYCPDTTSSHYHLWRYELMR